MLSSVEDRRRSGRPDVAIIGAGPAGLTAAYLLAKNRVSVTVLEADPDYVGGISRTIHYKGFCFDIGGHRFFSKSKQVEDLWNEILPNDMLERPRSSRIFYNNQFYSYPLKPLEALTKLGVWESALCALSYVQARIFPKSDPKTFQDWVTNQFGERLFRTFFKTYTEKVWGMSCKEISADWAAQRIKGLSLSSAIKNGLFSGRTSRESQIKTLIQTFRYPRKGPGMMWEACARKTRQMGGQILTGHRVKHCSFDRRHGKWSIEYQSRGGESASLTADHVISSAPLRELVQSITPEFPEPVIRAAACLKYRDFITVAVTLKDYRPLPDNWIYIHDPGVKVGRVQNYKSWSPEMVPDPSFCCYGLEYFCFEGDGLWASTDAELIELARRELASIGLARREDILDGCVVRQPKAYPVYDDDYAKNVASIREEIERNYPNLHLVGRNGMHKYNNQDHAMMTAMLTVENILAGAPVFDVWRVNQDAEYHEAGAAGEQCATSGLRLTPSRITA
ncbi:MAG TPA: NAD(P)/FAD-dependent oxidoreductase [Bryobacteraceae bacterium]|nr:NAD(P)/FAD-dependent oxidoreductase [Bryobacteraceae bacterium]